MCTGGDASRYACAAAWRIWKAANCRDERLASIGSAAFAAIGRSEASGQSTAAVARPTLAPAPRTARRETAVTESGLPDFGIWPMGTSVGGNFAAQQSRAQAGRFSDERPI